MSETFGTKRTLEITSKSETVSMGHIHRHVSLGDGTLEIPGHKFGLHDLTKHEYELIKIGDRYDVTITKVKA